MRMLSLQANVASCIATMEVCSNMLEQMNRLCGDIYLQSISKITSEVSTSSLHPFPHLPTL